MNSPTLSHTEAAEVNGAPGLSPWDTQLLINDNLQAQVKYLAGLVNLLTERVAALEGNPAEPEECRNKTCSYYTHYLAFGPKELEHEGSHAAMQMAERHFKHCDSTRVCKTCTDWEVRIRA